MKKFLKQNFIFTAVIELFVFRQIDGNMEEMIFIVRVDLFICLFIYSFTCLFVYVCVYLITYSFIYLFIYYFIYPFIHLSTYIFIYLGVSHKSILSSVTVI